MLYLLCSSHFLHFQLAFSYGKFCLQLQALAKEVVMSRKAVNRLYENKAQLNSISMHLGETVGIILPLTYNYFYFLFFSLLS